MPTAFEWGDSAVSLKGSFWQALGGHRSNSAEHQERVQKLKQSGAVALIKPGKSRDQVDLGIHTHTQKHAVVPSTCPHCCFIGLRRLKRELVPRQRARASPRGGLRRPSPCRIALAAMLRYAH
jgi:hypothetical protein